MLQTVVKKWFKDKESGFLDNGASQDILVRKADLINCKFLKVGSTVEFECCSGERGLVARKVKLLNQNRSQGRNLGNKPYRPGVMV